MDFVFLGLGNPSRRYRGTRHNVGKDLIEGLVRESNSSWHTITGGKVASLTLGIHCVVCMVSDGFMNETGRDMREALLEIDPMRLVVVHDEVALPVGSIRLSYNRTNGGHNGVASVEDVLGDVGFFRLRIGIGRSSDNLRKYVLEVIPSSDMDMIVHAMDAMLPEVIQHQLPDRYREVSMANARQ